MIHPFQIRFLPERLNRRLGSGPIGEAFQQFVFELLRPEYPGLQSYPAGGKDGGIDLSQPLADGGRSIFECKYIGTDGLEAAQARWREVAKNLIQNLADPAGPPAGQGQYAPWYAAGSPIRFYTFCISSVLQNENQRQSLRSEIQELFSRLTRERPHLAHLAGIKVEILPWQDLSARLTDHPHLLFRWFPDAWPHGLALLGEGREGVGFRDYLNRERLPYYTREHHLTGHPAPLGSRIAAEETLLLQMENPATVGLVVTGGGGFGKTRLMLELGRRAQTKGWVVFRVRGRLRSDSLDHLADRLAPGTPALLLIDYVETQPDYAELVESLTLLADERQIPLHYVACCRSSFYPSIRLIGRHAHVDLSPEASDPAAEAWQESYREKAVQHILVHTGVPEAPQVALACRKVPVLAVFAAWLHELGRHAELNELIRERDFGLWVLKRIQQSFPGRAIGGSLATLMALLPLPEPATDRLTSEQCEVLNTLAVDAWVERVAPEDQPAGCWEAAHDVLADQVLLAHLDTIAPTARSFVRDLLAEGARVGAVASVLTALQRVAFTPVLQGLPWLDLLAEALSQHPAAWKEARLLVLRSPLLTASAKVKLLGRTESVWDGAEVEVGFQNVIGWIAGYEAKHRELQSEEQARLTSWLQRLAPLVSRSNYLLSKGLLLDPPSVREAALRWLLEWPTFFQTHYLLRAWLEVGQPIEEVREVVRLWLQRFELSFHASFVLTAWLDNGGELEAVREHLLPWLNTHELLPEASFTFEAWLDNGGEVEEVREHLLPWLKTHELLPEARFVFKAWLDNGGQVEDIREHLLSWLKTHELLPEASFVFKAWLDNGGEVEDVREHLLPWLKTHEFLPEAQFVFQAWLDNGGEVETVREHLLFWLKTHEFLPEAQFVFQAWLDNGGEVETVREHLLSWLKIHELLPEASFSFEVWLGNGGEVEAVREHLFGWLQKNSSLLEASFVMRAWLDAGGDFDLAREHAITWFQTHWKTPEAGFILKYLGRQQELSTEVVQKILTWCRHFAADNDALWRLTSLASHLLRTELQLEVASASAAVIRAALAQPEPPPIRCALVSLLFSILGQSASLRLGTRSLFLEWLRHPSSHFRFYTGHDGTPSRLQYAAEKESLLFYLGDLIQVGALSVDRERPAIQRFFRWIGEWTPRNRDRAREALVRFVELSKHQAAHPHPGQVAEGGSSDPPESPR